MKTAITLIAACALTACAATRSHVEIQRVSIAVPLECKESIPARPIMPTEALRPGATVDQYVQASAAEIERREGYEVKLVTALEACTRPIEPAPAKEPLGLQDAWPGASVD